MNEKYHQTLEHGKAVMNRFPAYSQEWEMGRQMVAFACERIREMAKVVLVFPPAVVGSLEEKCENQALEVLTEK